MTIVVDNAFFRVPGMAHSSILLKKWFSQNFHRI